MRELSAPPSELVADLDDRPVPPGMGIVLAVVTSLAMWGAIAAIYFLA